MQNNTTEMGDSTNCASELTQKYDVRFHIAGIFILMGCSFMGTMIPILAKKITVLKVCFSGYII